MALSWLSFNLGNRLKTHTLNALIEPSERKSWMHICLLTTIQEVQEIAKEWLKEYNAVRPHEALGGLPPHQFMARKP